MPGPGLWGARLLSGSLPRPRARMERPDSSHGQAGAPVGPHLRAEALAHASAPAAIRAAVVRILRGPRNGRGSHRARRGWRGALEPGESSLPMPPLPLSPPRSGTARDHTSGLVASRIKPSDRAVTICVTDGREGFKYQGAKAPTRPGRARPGMRMVRRLIRRLSSVAAVL